MTVYTVINERQLIQVIRNIMDGDTIIFTRNAVIKNSYIINKRITITGSNRNINLSFKPRRAIQPLFQLFADGIRITNITLSDAKAGKKKTSSLVKSYVPNRNVITFEIDNTTFNANTSSIVVNGREVLITENLFTRANRCRRVLQHLVLQEIQDLITIRRNTVLDSDALGKGNTFVAVVGDYSRTGDINLMENNTEQTKRLFEQQSFFAREKGQIGLNIAGNNFNGEQMLWFLNNQPGNMDIFKSIVVRDNSAVVRGSLIGVNTGENIADEDFNVFQVADNSVTVGTIPDAPLELYTQLYIAPLDVAEPNRNKIQVNSVLSFLTTGETIQFTMQGSIDGDTMELADNRGTFARVFVPDNVDPLKAINPNVFGKLQELTLNTVGERNYYAIVVKNFEPRSFGGDNVVMNFYLKTLDELFKPLGGTPLEFEASVPLDTPQDFLKIYRLEGRGRRARPQLIEQVATRVPGFANLYSFNLSENSDYFLTEPATGDTGVSVVNPYQAIKYMVKH